MGEAAAAKTIRSTSEGGLPIRSSSVRRSSSDSSNAAKAGMRTEAMRSRERCVSGSNTRSDKIVSPSSSTRTGSSRSGGKTSRRPPRTARSPVSMTRSPRRYPTEVSLAVRRESEIVSPWASARESFRKLSGEGRRVKRDRAGRMIAETLSGEASAASSANSSRRALSEGGIRW